MSALIVTIPWYLWLAGGVFVTFTAYRYLGRSAAITAAVAAAAALLYSLGHKRAKEAAKTEELKDAIEVHTTGAEARATAERRDADPERLRESDGFRRD